MVRSHKKIVPYSNLAGRNSIDPEQLTQKHPDTDLEELYRDPVRQGTKAHDHDDHERLLEATGDHAARHRFRT